MNTATIAKTIILLGIGLVFAGLIFWGFSKIGGPLGKLPGDIKVQGEKFSFHFPIVTSIVISIILTIVINFLLYLFRK